MLLRAHYIFGLALALTGIPTAPVLGATGSDAKSCIIHLTSGGYPKLVNVCSYPVEAVWCSGTSGACDAYDSRANIKVGGEYPVSRLSIITGGCRGFDSVSNIQGFSYECVVGKE